jgi:hypothetical protein
MELKFDDDTYQKAIDTVAQMVAAMLEEDNLVGDEDARDEYLGQALEGIRHSLINLT